MLINIFNMYSKKCYQPTILLVIVLIGRASLSVRLVCVLLGGAPVCLEAGKATASHFWLELVW